MGARTKNILKLTVAAVVLYFIAIKFIENWSEVRSFEWRLDYFQVIISIALHLVTFLLFSKVWCWLMRSYGHTVAVKHAFKIAYLLNLGRYVPGKIWPVFGMAYLAKRIGISERESVSSWIVAQLYANLSSALVCITIAMIEPSIRDYLFQTLPEVVALSAVGVVFLGVAVLLASPHLMNSALNVVLRALKRNEVELRITRGESLRLLFGYVLSWGMYGVAFWVFINSLSPAIHATPLVSIGAFVVAYQVGYLAFFVPGGIGVREAAISIALKPFIGEAAFGVAVAARLWNMIVEISAALIAYKFPLPDSQRETTESMSDRNC